MRPMHSAHLIAAIVVVSIAAEASPALATAGIYSFETSVSVAWGLIVLNLAIGIVGLWTEHRAAWIAYLVLSIALSALIGAVTPLSVLGILARLYA